MFIGDANLSRPLLFIPYVNHVEQIVLKQHYF